jgi:hypothetical protein
LNTCAAALDTVEVASSSTPSSLLPISPPAIRMLPASGPGVLVGVAVGVDDVLVAVAVTLGVAVAVAVTLGVAVAVAVTVGVAVAVAVTVGVAVAVEVAVVVGVAVAVAVGVDVEVAVAVSVAVAVAVAVSVAVAVEVGVAVAAAVDVAVAVGDGVVLNEIPVRLTVCVVFFALSSKVSFPVSVVPLGVLAVVGLNVTETWQLEFASNEAPQLFAVISYGWLALIEVKVTATPFGLERVAVCGGEIVSTWTLP